MRWEERMSDERVKQLLQKLEYAGEGGYREEDACPDCGGSPYGIPMWQSSAYLHRNHIRTGHDSECMLATLLTEFGVPECTRDS